MKTGQRIICIDDFFEDEDTNPFDVDELILPEAGREYTVREVVRTDYGIGLRLEEIRNEEYYFENVCEYQEPIFGKNRFSPVE
jgi:hypothetical protein